MLRAVRSFWKKLTGSSLQRSDFSSGTGQRLENYDAVTARHDANVESDGGYAFPPNYVRPVDEGRPRK
jgi:hypothetical protein